MPPRPSTSLPVEATAATPSRWLACRIAGAYLVLGGLWILVSGWMLHHSGLPSEFIDRLEVAKGWIFIVVTAALLGWMLNRYFSMIRRAAESLRASEIRFRALIENAPDGIALVSAAGAITYASPSACRMFGRAGEEFHGLDPAANTHPDDLEGVLDSLRQVLAAPACVRTREYRFRHANGGWIWIESTFTNLVGRPGVDAIVINFRNVHDRKLAEEAVRESELRRTLALEAARMGTWDFDLTSGRVAWTGLHRNVWGFAPGSSPVTIEEFTRRIQPDDLAALNAVGERAMAERHPFESEYRVINPDGGVHWMRSHGRHLFDAAGRATRIVGVVFEVTERKAADAALEAEATRRRILIDGSRDGIVVLDRDGKVFEANRRFAEMLGYTAEEVGDLHVWDWDRSWPADRVLEAIRQLGPDGERIETRHSRKDGTFFDVELSNSAADLGGQKLVFCVCHDITERKRAEARAARDAQRAQFLLELHQRAPGMTDRDLLHCVLECAVRLSDSCAGQLHLFSEDQATIEAFATSPADANSRGDAPTSESAAGPSGSEPWAPCLKEQRPLTWRDGNNARRGLAVPVVQSGRTRILCVVEGKGSDYDAGDIGQLQEVVGELHKLILLRAAQNRLRLSEQRFRHLVETAFDWVWETNAEGRFTYASPRVQDILGYTPAEVVGRRPVDLMPAEEARRVEQVFVPAMNARAALAGIENVNRHKDGHEVVLETSGVPVFGDHGEFLGYRGMDRDVSERRRLESQLRQAQKLEAIGQLAGGVAHDFNNILAAIQMQIDLLQMDPGLDTGTRGGLKDLELEAQRAASLTRQLLMFSRRSVLEIRLLDLNEVVKGLLRMLGRLIGEHIKLLFDGFTGTLPLVNADAGMIEQVLMNLVVNARDAMPRGGHVTIGTSVVRFDGETTSPGTAARRGRFVCLTVADTGIGMSGELMERIFEPFFTTKEPGKGTGLGLATVHGIVAQHRGWVDVESAIGVGTTFRVYLPALEEAPTTPANAPVAGPIPRGTETILVVEDEAPLRKTIMLALGALGYRVLGAANGPQALEVWRDHGDGVDILFTDMVMPEGLTGLELAERLRADRPGLPVIISSGYSTEIVQSGGINQPGIRYLPKPYLTRELAEAIRERLGKPGAGKQEP